MANLTGDAFEFDQSDSDISRRVLEWNNKFCIVLVGDVASAALPGQGRAQGQAKGSNGGSGGMQMFDFLQWHPVAAVMAAVPLASGNAMQWWLWCLGRPHCCRAGKSVNVAITDKAMCKQGIIFMKPAGEPPCTNLGAALA